MKRSLQRFLSSPSLFPIWHLWHRDRFCIFTLHRFARSGDPRAGHDPDVLRALLERLRHEQFALLDLEDAFALLECGEQVPPRSICFTVDDGYSDFGTVAADIFLDYDCPVTVFLPTGFVSRSTWLWWDIVQWIFLQTTTPVVRFTHDDLPFSFGLGDRNSRTQAASSFSVWLTRRPEEEKWRFIHSLAAAAAVEVPPVPPAAYSALSWDDARLLEGRGIRFGPHTVSHPCLTMASDDVARREILESWTVIREQLTSPVPVFSYPNGDHGCREIDLCMEAGLAGAVSTVPEYVSGGKFRAVRHNRYQVPRFAYPDGVTGAILTASGFSRASLGVRKAIRRFA